MLPYPLDIHQLNLIMDVLGTPHAEFMKKISSESVSVTLPSHHTQLLCHPSRLFIIFFFQICYHNIHVMVFACIKFSYFSKLFFKLLG